MTTVHISIGNSDGKLSHTVWASYWESVDKLLRVDAVTHVYGVWHSLPARQHVNACWAVEIQPEYVEVIKGELRRLARIFGQDSIAWLEGHTEFLAPERIVAVPQTDLGNDPDGDLDGADYPPFPAGHR